MLDYRTRKMQRYLDLQTIFYLSAKFGRGDWNRTSDPLHPMQVLYQAELRPDTRVFIQSPRPKCKIKKLNRKKVKFRTGIIIAGFCFI